MNSSGPIIIVEDDVDDQELYTDVFQALNIKNEVVIFSDGESAYNHLLKDDVHPFLIITDVNMPKMTGMELREKIQQGNDIRLKTVPFIFFTTAVSKDIMIKAYLNSVQGFFTKPSSYQKIEATLQCIVDYWTSCSEVSKF